QLALRRIPLLTVRQLSRERASVERPLPSHEIPGLSCRFPCPRRVDRLSDNAACNRRIFLEKSSQLLVQNRLDNAFDFGVAELRLRLAFELRPGNLDADDGGEALADIVAGDAFLQVLAERVL